MSDQFIPIRQNVPLNTARSQHAPGFSRTADDPSDLSFQAILNRQQMSRGQTKSMRQTLNPQQAHHFAASQSNASQAKSSAKSSPAMPAITNPRELAKNENVPPEMKELLKQAPEQIPQGKELYQTMLQNAEDYRKMKAQNSTGETPSRFQQIFKNSASQSPVERNAPAAHRASAFFSPLNNPPQRPPINAELMGEAANRQAATAASSFHAALAGRPTDVDAAGSNAVRSSATSPSREANGAKTHLGQTAAAKSAKASPSSDKPGPGESFFSFFKNIASAVTLGFYQPNEQNQPQGVMRVIDPFKKLFWEAPKSLLYDTPSRLAQALNEPSSAASSRQSAQEKEVAHNRSSHRASRYASSKPWMNHV